MAAPAAPSPAPGAGSSPAPSDGGADLLNLLRDASWVWRQYDHQLFLNTVEGPGGDAAVLRLRHPTSGADTGRALALTTDGNHRWCAVDPFAGTALVVAEAVLNLACVGARPLALVNCLNFGNPEHPEVMWQLSQAIDGMAWACSALGIPVVGGNVSLYNESRGRDIDPTPVVGLLGMVDQLERRPPGPGLAAGHRLLLVGDEPNPTLTGSQWASDVAGVPAAPGSLERPDLARHTAVCNLVRDLVNEGQVSGVHDVAEGGLALTLAEMAVRSGTGFRIESPCDDLEGLFSEGPSRAVVCVAEASVGSVIERVRAGGVPVADLGEAGGERLVIGGLVDVALGDATDAWREDLPAALAAGAVH